MKLKSLALAASIFLAVPCFSQQPEKEMTKEEMEEKIYESIDAEIKRLNEYIGLEYWQEFYVDSILTHDYLAMNDEVMALQKSGATNSTAYSVIYDKWMESVYQGFKKIFNEAQWKRYEKIGAGKAKKDRDKRTEKLKAGKL